jgi:hypothetical protein
MVTLNSGVKIKTCGKTTVADGVGEVVGDGEAVGVTDALGVGVELGDAVAVGVDEGVVVADGVGDGTDAHPAIASNTAHTASNNQIFLKPGEWCLMISS